MPTSSFSALSNTQIDLLRAEIARLDHGRIWIVVVSPRSESALADFAGPVFGDLPAGTFIAVAEDARDPSTTNYWVGSTLESGDAAQTQLNNVINGYHKGQGSLFDDLRLEIQSFARSDAAAGHPALSSAGNSGQTGATGGGGAGNAALIAVAIVVAILLLTSAVVGGRHVRGMLRASHRRRQETADARERAKSDFGKLAEEIEALDIDSSMPNASPAGKDEYAQALDCYEEAERRMRQLEDDYQFEHAVEAVNRGLTHVRNADRLLNPKRKAQR
ncbi:MAG: hypothetical protein ACLP01_07440 [Solirubrobacteraceae bacterium]